MLAGLCSQDEYCLRTFSPFKLVCVVLHDPEDTAFKTKMRDQFSDLYERTGENMLFVTFVNPPKAWVDSHRDMDLQEIELANLGAEVRFDDRLMLRHFVRSISGYVSLPCILITHDLLSNEYCLLDTSVDRFEEQLVQIGEYCSNTDGRFVVGDERFQRWISSLGRARFSSLPSRSIADELAGTLALQELRSRDGLAKNFARQRLSDLQVAMEASGDGAGPEAVAYYNYESGLMEKSYSGPRSRPPFYSQFEFDVSRIRGFKDCSVFSRDNVRQYNALLPIFMSMGMESENYKPLACFLTDFLEREVNLSLVQQMRQCFGIEMPDYYCVFKKDVWALVETREERVSLNSVRYPDLWVPVMFGQAYYAYCAMSLPSSNPHLDHSLGQGFLDVWYRLLQYRNMIGHSFYREEDCFDYQKFQGFHNSVSEFFCNYLWQMQDIKKSLLSPVDRSVSIFGDNGE